MDIIKFTIEHVTNTFQFLNMKMKFNDFYLNSWVYRKPTHIDLIFNLSVMCLET